MRRGTHCMSAESLDSSDRIPFSHRVTLVGESGSSLPVVQAHVVGTFLVVKCYVNKPRNLYVSAVSLVDKHSHRLDRNPPQHLICRIAMGFFNRRSAAADPETAAATGTHEKKQGIFAKRGHSAAAATTHNGTPAWNTRPTFGQWIKATALDIVTMAAMGAIGKSCHGPMIPAMMRHFERDSSIGVI